MEILRQVILAVLFVLPGIAFGTGVIDINSADKPTLMQIQGVGESRAEAIINYREQYGPFMSVDELTEVQGIGQKTLDDNRDRLTAGNPQ